MIGCSLSMCVLDIARGKVEIGDVERMICSTRVQKWRDWARIIRDYRKNYWGSDPDRCARIASRLIARYRRNREFIWQPRLDRKPNMPQIGGGKRWANSMEDIQWSRK